MTVTLNRGTRELLRAVARHTLDAGNWLERYERSGNPEHRLNAVRAVMDARDMLQRAEVCVREGLEATEAAT